MKQMRPLSIPAAGRQAGYRQMNNGTVRYQAATAKIQKKAVNCFISYCIYYTDGRHPNI
jgi:hypothetical protein